MFSHNTSSESLNRHIQEGWATSGAGSGDKEVKRGEQCAADETKQLAREQALKLAFLAGEKKIAEEQEARRLKRKK
ncbi:MAG: hypothetical protein PHU23_01005 [Dehalococcoidales bacterium]|nr:hypothetical protein [Dehalococcoidales bacterium]